MTCRLAWTCLFAILATTAYGHETRPAYLRLGTEHILTGFDHLLFVVGLALSVKSRWRPLERLVAVADSQ
jgi:hydrogenase/urease accessory protein HupE